jgi:hypothetical protein
LKSLLSEKGKCLVSPYPGRVPFIGRRRLDNY